MQGLFDDVTPPPSTGANAAPVPAAAPVAASTPATNEAPRLTAEQAAEAARHALAASNIEPLSDTLDALKRLPESLRAAAEEVSRAIFQTEAIRLLTSRFLDPTSAADPGRRITTVVHSAKLATLSAVSYFASSPWQVADGTLLKRIEDDLAGSKGFDAALRRLDGVRSINLFVAAVDTDDRETYLKAVKGLVKRHKVHGLVFDAELVEWLPEAEFLSACEEVGLRPIHIGIADRARASTHSMMRPELTPRRTPALYVDSHGRQLQLSAEGAVLPHAAPAPEQVAPIATQAPAPAAPHVSAPAAPPVATAPSSAIQERLAKIRAQQNKHRGPAGARP